MFQLGIKHSVYDNYNYNYRARASPYRAMARDSTLINTRGDAHLTEIVIKVWMVLSQSSWLEL